MPTEQPFDHNGECRFCDELGMHRADCSWLLKLQADYDEAVRLYRERDAQAARYHDRLQIDPGGSDRIDELEAATEHLRVEIERLRAALDDIATADSTKDDARALISVAQVALNAGR
jgi:hypothetical protein